MASLSQTNATQTSVTIRCSDLDGSFNRTRYFIWQIYRGTSKVDEKTNTTSAYATSNSVTFSGLDIGVSNYSIKCGIYQDAGYSSLLASLDLYYVYTLGHLTPTINSLSVVQTYQGGNTARCTWSASNVESNAYYWIDARESGTSTWYYKKDGRTSSSSGSVDITLDGFKIYDVIMYIQNAEGYVGSRQASVTMYPVGFSWTYAKTKGGTFNLTADEWNGLWDAIEIRLGRSYSHTRAYRGDTFTAAMYNEAVDAIGKGTRVSRGDEITATLMNALVTNVNNM